MDFGVGARSFADKTCAAVWGGRGAVARPWGARWHSGEHSETGHIETGIAVKIQSDRTSISVLYTKYMVPGTC